jgi:predicted nuclease of predicted toxin-antitoxin system
MSLKLLMDVHIPYEITVRLRAAGVDVLTAQEDGSDELKDPALLDRALELDREVFTHDDHFLAEATRRQRAGVSFACVFFAKHVVGMSRIYAEWLETYAKLESPETARNRVIFIP